MASRKTKIAIIGAGGHSRVIISTLKALGHTIKGIYDDTRSLWGKDLQGVPILGPLKNIEDHDGHAVIGIGDNAARKNIAESLNCNWMTVIHPFSWVDPTATIGEGTVIFAGSVVQAAAVIGSHVIVNTRSSVDHNCAVGDYSHISVAHLGGWSTIGEGAFLAIGSSVIDRISIGKWSTLGAGAVAIREIPPYTIAAGVPAKVIRVLEPKGMAHNKKGIPLTAIGSKTASPSPIAD
jgi:sugar O-acyltransferase (sialic acid O-acetyltransferase NeuD family)